MLDLSMIFKCAAACIYEFDRQCVPHILTVLTVCSLVLSDSLSISRIETEHCHGSDSSLVQ